MRRLARPANRCARSPTHWESVEGGLVGAVLSKNQVM
jgi:hypothetical protein